MGMSSETSPIRVGNLCEAGILKAITVLGEIDAQIAELEDKHEN